MPKMEEEENYLTGQGPCMSVYEVELFMEWEQSEIFLWMPTNSRA